MQRSPAPGAVVAFWDGNTLAFGTAAGEEKQRVRLILSSGKEERLLAARIAFEVEAPAVQGEDRVAAGRRAASAASRVEALATEVDVPLLWELARDGSAEADLGELAAAALGGNAGLQRAALALAFVREGIRFLRRGDVWVLRDADGVAEMERQREREAARAGERKRFIGALSALLAGNAWTPDGSETERRGLRALHDLAVFDLSASDSVRDLACAILDEALAPGDRPAERAFRLLRKLGVFIADDENLHARRLGLTVGFPEAVTAAALVAVARGWARDGRADLRDLCMITVDGAATRDIDDGLSVEPTTTGWRLGIHVADPAAFIVPGDPVDAEALSRATSHYMPDLRVPMLPALISEVAASLVEGEDRPSLSIFVDVGPDGKWSAYDVQKSMVRSRARLDYDQADEAIRSGDQPHATLLRMLHDVSAVLERRRAAQGALIMKAAELDVRVEDGGRIRLERIEPASPSRRLVSEAMVLAGEVAARFCIDRAIPALFRRQPPPASLVVVPPGAESDPVVVRSVRRSLRRGEVATVPGPHFALGLAAYSQVTSPLRRYQDLVVHRQIGATLAGTALPYRADEIQTVAATTERAEGAARDAERSANRYWLLKYLEASAAHEVAAIVLDVAPTVVQLEETLLEERVPALTDGTPGERVTLSVERINPRADLLILRPARRP